MYYQTYPKVVALDYDSIIHSQISGTTKSRYRVRWLSMLFKAAYLFRKVLWLRDNIIIFNRNLSASLMVARGTYLTLREKGLNPSTDVDKLISDTGIVIKAYSELLQSMEDILHGAAGLKLKSIYPIDSSISLIKETLECYYDITRYIKKAGIKKPIETSQLAKDAAAISANSLETILHGS